MRIRPVVSFWKMSLPCLLQYSLPRVRLPHELVARIGNESIAISSDRKFNSHQICCMPNCWNFHLYSVIILAFRQQIVCTSLSPQTHFIPGIGLIPLTRLSIAVIVPALHGAQIWTPDFRTLNQIRIPSQKMNLGIPLCLHFGYEILQNFQTILT